jgi:hypothetical protein
VDLTAEYIHNRDAVVGALRDRAAITRSVALDESAMPVGMERAQVVCGC